MLQQVAELLAAATMRRSTDRPACVRARAPAALAEAHDLDLLELVERSMSVAGAGRCGDDVDVLDAVGAAARGAGELRSRARAADAAQPGDDRLADLQRPRQQDPRPPGRAPRRRASARATSTLCSNFGPRPFTVRSRCASAASRSASSESMPSSAYSSRARLGPRPGRRVIATRPGGNFARSFSAAGIVPVSSSVWIFSWSVLPIPGSSVARPSRASAATDTDASRTALAAALR